MFYDNKIERTIEKEEELKRYTLGLLSEKEVEQAVNNNVLE